MYTYVKIYQARHFIFMHFMYVIQIGGAITNHKHNFFSVEGLGVVYKHTDIRMSVQSQKEYFFFK